jgi:four helix bundle protein
MKRSIIADKTFNFSLEIIKVVSILKRKHKEFDMSRQLFRSATSIGANVEEALGAFSKKDFIYKMTIALKESNETIYWLKLINNSEYKSDNIFLLIEVCEEIRKILRSIILTSQENLNNINPS